LRFVFLLIMRLAAWLRLSRREETWKTAEILILRHQLTGSVLSDHPYNAAEYALPVDDVSVAVK
jgi:hypothetical protein